MKKLLLFIFVSIGSINAQTCFTYAPDAPVGSTPQLITSGDFNGDGKSDIAVSNYWGPSTVSVLLGTGSGNFSTNVVYSVGLNPYGLTCKDFNGDGKIDLAVASWNSSTPYVSVLNGAGTGTFAAAINYTIGTGGSMRVETADFNNDGFADLVTVRKNSNNISVSLGTGSGTFPSFINYPVGTTPDGITIKDFNNDGIMDLAVANSGSNDVSVLKGLAGGSFAAAVNYNVGNSPHGITNNDFNGDGKIDLAVVNKNSNTISVLIGNGSGAFATAVNYAVGTMPMEIVSSDFNNDGKIDLAVSNNSSNTISVLTGAGTGTFSAATNYTVGSNPTGIVARDFNNDGKSDLGVVNSGSDNVTILLNCAVSVVTTSASSNTICSGASSVIQASGATSYTWSTGSTSSSITVSPIVTTTYSVQGLLAGTTYTASHTITVNSSPTLTVNSGAICSGKTFSIVPGGASTYTITGGSFNVSPTATTNYSITGASAQGCAGSNVAVSTVSVNLTPAITANSGAICSGKTFSVIPGGASTYTITGGSFNVSPTATTNYSVTGTSAQGCAGSNTAVSSVTVNPLPAITVTSSQTMICVGQTATLTAAGGNTYTWSTGSTGPMLTVSPTTTVNYTVTGTNSNGCSAMAGITQNVSLCTGIEGHANLRNAVMAYPNPNNGVFTLDLPVKAQIVLLNTLGQIIISDTLEAGIHAIDIQKEAPGMYLVKISFDNQEYNSKIIKN